MKKAFLAFLLLSFINGYGQDGRIKSPVTKI